MPTYDYQCENCGHAFEKFQSITASVIRKCPQCGRMKLQRLIGTGSGIIFKGSGFYETDYKNKNYQKDKQPGEPKAAESSEGTKSENKTEAKAEAKPSETKTPESKPDTKKAESKPKADKKQQ